MHQARVARHDSAFVEKVNLFSQDFLRYCVYLSKSEPERETFTKRLYSQMVSSSKLLEDFLDFHGAKNNSIWYYYRELVSSVRNLAEACYSQKHIYVRLPSYELTDADRFEEAGYATHKFLITSLRTICCNVLEEGGCLHIEFPKDRLGWEDFPGITTCNPLESDIADENLEEEQKNIVKISTDFLRAIKDFEMHGFYEPCAIDEIKSIVPARFNEVEARRFEMVIHSLQSSFDTYVNRSGLRLRNIKLKRLRGYISVVLHLLELTRRLLHYYERHLHEVGYKNIYKKVRDELTKAVEPEQLLKCIVNYGLYYISYFLVNGQNLAHDLLNENMERGTILMGVPEKMGFHSRPSLLVAKIVEHHGGQVELCVGYDRFDAGSVLDLQWAGGKIQKENIKEVVFQGDVRALKDIRILAGVNYGEDSMGKGIPLPKELFYLKQ
ncbi:MAG: HPr family phosphocarrier protein [Desulfobacterales bacterium]|nr:HPr family phosphocarrier protein [Desulfobacterales bacterium]